MDSPDTSRAKEDHMDCSHDRAAQHCGNLVALKQVTVHNRQIATPF
jgi:hypothetical protein